MKNSDDPFKIKSLEELKLEQIQKHDAAMYKYDQTTEIKTKVRQTPGFLFCKDTYSKFVRCYLENWQNKNRFEESITIKSTS